MQRKTQINLWYAALAVFLLLLFQSWWVSSQQVEQIPYSRFQQLLDQGKIAKVAVQDKYIRGELKEPQDGKRFFITTRVDPDIAKELEAKGVTFTGVVESTLLRDILSWILPVLFFFGFWAFFVRRMAERQGLGGADTVGELPAQIFGGEGTQEGF